jgi:peptidyl-prolyl cis-trans isomerase SurA
VLKRRVARTALSGLLLAVAVSGLTACRTSPNVAAYVGDEQVTVSELEAAVDARLGEEGLAAYAENDEAGFTRQVLYRLVTEEVYAAAAEHYGVQVTDAQVRSRIDELLGEDDPESVYAQLAQQGIGRQDVVASIRQQLLRREIAAAEGKAVELSDEELQARYEEVRQDQQLIRFGYITVPDQATADRLAAQLEADPLSYPAVAAQYAGQYTLAELTDVTPDQVPGPLAEQVAAAAPNTAFTVPVAELQGIVVTFVAGPVYPTLEDLRPQLEQEATDATDAAGAELVDDVRADLDVVVNPRYGVLEDDGQLGPAGGDSAVVDILEDDAGSAAAPGAAGGAGE